MNCGVHELKNGFMFKILFEFRKSKTGTNTPYLSPSCRKVHMFYEDIAPFPIRHSRNASFRFTSTSKYIL